VDTCAIRPGDIVLVDQRRCVFYARVLGAGATCALTVAPLDPARQVPARTRRRGRRPLGARRA